uniref:PUM-HD domain-containing protein n=1 Tax=Erythrolobus australicus TaxID=1077150 RepID=A0A7S1TMF1_9RHOD|mmetsp:Transcript_3942/g.10832  ORF Transcript_3942/g.10832 Transcript_3942/m.10832 type:complete len:884 (+) Transcript_3942:222-2873(+)
MVVGESGQRIRSDRLKRDISKDTTLGSERAAASQRPLARSGSSAVLLAAACMNGGPRDSHWTYGTAPMPELCATSATTALSLDGASSRGPAADKTRTDSRIPRVDSDASVEELFREAVRLRSVASSASLQKLNTASPRVRLENSDWKGESESKYGGGAQTASQQTMHGAKESLMSGYEGPGMGACIWGPSGISGTQQISEQALLYGEPGSNNPMWTPLASGNSRTLDCSAPLSCTSETPLFPSAVESYRNCAPGGLGSSRYGRSHLGSSPFVSSAENDVPSTVPTMHLSYMPFLGGTQAPVHATNSDKGDAFFDVGVAPTMHMFSALHGPSIVGDQHPKHPFLQSSSNDSSFSGVSGVAYTAQYLDAYGTLATYDVAGAGSAGATAKLSLLDLTGRVVELARDQHGCRFLQTQLDEGGFELRDQIFDEVRGHFAELAVDPFGNYLCQKLFEACSDSQRLELIEQSEGVFAAISTNTHGTRAVQRIVDCMSTQQHIDAVVHALKPAAVVLMKDVNGNHVIQRCLNRLAPANNQFVYDAVASNVVELATHRHGCCVIQRCMDHANRYQRGQVVEEVTRNALTLVQNAFGNYVVQYVLDLAEPAYTLQVIKRLQGSLSVLSVQKFSSNVIEKCLEQAPPDYRALLIGELISSEELVGRLLFDAYGNYVVQRALTVAQSPQLEILCEAIYPHLPGLRSSPYGKRIQAKIMKRMPRHVLYSNVSSGAMSNGPAPVHSRANGFAPSPYAAVDALGIEDNAGSRAQFRPVPGVAQYRTRADMSRDAASRGGVSGSRADTSDDWAHFAHMMSLSGFGGMSSTYGESTLVQNHSNSSNVSANASNWLPFARAPHSAANPSDRESDLALDVDARPSDYSARTALQPGARGSSR